MLRATLPAGLAPQLGHGRSAGRGRGDGDGGGAGADCGPARRVGAREQPGGGGRGGDWERGEQDAAAEADEEDTEPDLDALAAGVHEGAWGAGNRYREVSAAASFAVYVSLRPGDGLCAGASGVSTTLCVIGCTLPT